MNTLFIFGLGYTSQVLVERLDADWEVVGTTRSGVLPSPVEGQGGRVREPLLIFTSQTPNPDPSPHGGREKGSVLRFDDTVAVTNAITSATHILSSVPPDDNPAHPDPVLRHYGAALKTINPRWLGYLSSTGVYGDTGGAWVDESSPIGTGRRTTRADCDLAWQQDTRSHIFRLPGIYGPTRSPLNRVRTGRAHRIDLPGHVFCRIHVADIVSTLIASMKSPQPGIYNISDDEPASGAAVTEYACDLTGTPYPALQSLTEASLSPMGRDFYAESRRVDNRKIKHDLGVRLAYPTYREGITACLKMEH